MARDSPLCPATRHQMTASAACRSGRHGAGWPGLWVRSWHAWRTGTPARLAAASLPEPYGMIALGRNGELILAVYHQQTELDDMRTYAPERSQLHHTRLIGGMETRRPGMP